MTTDNRTNDPLQRAHEIIEHVYKNELGIPSYMLSRQAALALNLEGLLKTPPRSRTETSKDRTRTRQAASVERFGEQRYARWTAEQDAVVLDESLSREEKMHRTQRTYQAILTRKRRLKGTKDD